MCGGAGDEGLLARHVQNCVRALSPTDPGSLQADAQLKPQTFLSFKVCFVDKLQSLAFQAWVSRSRVQAFMC